VAESLVLTDAHVPVAARQHVEVPERPEPPGKKINDDLERVHDSSVTDHDALLPISRSVRPRNDDRS
jgi:hypothetical protein